MTFASEELRTKFHLLPTQKQYEWAQLEYYLADSGKMLHVEHIDFAPTGELNISVSVRDFARVENSDPQAV